MNRRPLHVLLWLHAKQLKRERSAEKLPYTNLAFPLEDN
ncbi:hypothetical protein RLEG12_07845 (plasmid) [Rhizobium leguminosarum bv. trifolii CB782]|nr:hypothetical protein RLEG12_07845 [Rhizobium leguminosarum bv. trifolii CB782]